MLLLLVVLPALLHANSPAQTPSMQQTPAPQPAPIIPGVSGTIVDAQGALVSGAQLRLSSADNTSGQQATSSPDGTFTFDYITPGDFTLTVSLKGFVTTTTTGTLQSGQNLQLPPVVLQLAATFFKVEVHPEPMLTVEQQIQAEEQQRLGGFAPNFFISYDWNAAPLSSRQKFALSWATGRDPANLLLVGAFAGIQQAENSFNGYGRGAPGYGKRFGANLASLEVGTFLGGAVFPSLFHQDPRYFYKGTGTIRSRIVYALSTAVIQRGDNGQRQFAISSVLGDLSAGAISNLYYPASNRNGPGLTIENGLLGVAGDALNGIFQEFVARRLTPSANRQTP
jgi:hypothetical protein